MDNREYPYRISTMREADLEEVARLMTEVFLEDEPLTRAVPMSYEGFLSWCLRYACTQQHVKQNLSCVARRIDDNRLVGFLLMDDWGHHAEPEPDEEDFDAVDAFVTHVLQQYKRIGVPPRCAYANYLGVAKDARCKGLGTRLVREGLRRAREADFGSVFAITSAVASQKIFASCGFREVFEVPYGTFEFEGKRPFAEITQPPSCKVHELNIECKA